MEVVELAKVLERLGCPVAKAPTMAAQLDKRAKMDAERRGVSYAAALQHLITLMSQGWAVPREQRS